VPLPAAFYARPVLEVAPALVGCTLTHAGVTGVIVETEAYHQSEPACHAHVGVTPRTHILFGPPGRAYVYRSYGIHWCLNFVCEEGSAVLIRALEPTHGLEEMAVRRGTDEPRLLASGPGRLTQALAVTKEHDGLPLDRPPFALYAAGDTEIEVGTRIGITKAVELPWRYGESGSRFLSRPLRSPSRRA
jgi:DNA-3-methyladenine glycosylase